MSQDSNVPCLFVERSCSNIIMQALSSSFTSQVTGDTAWFSVSSTDLLAWEPELFGWKSFNTSVVFALVSCTSTLETDYSTALFSKKRVYLFRLIRPMGSPTFPVSSQRVGRFPSFPSPPVSKPQRGLPEPRPVCDQCGVR